MIKFGIVRCKDVTNFIEICHNTELNIKHHSESVIVNREQGFKKI